MRAGWSLLGLVVALLLTNGAAIVGMAQEQAFPAYIYEGSCGDLGGEFAQLSESALPGGERVGLESAKAAAESFSTIPLVFDLMVANDHALAIEDPESGELLACGDVGGFMNANGALVFGLTPENDSGVAGIAYLSPSSDASQTDISLFFFGDALSSLAAASVQPSVTPRAGSASSERPSLTAGGEVSGDAIDQVMATTEAEIPNVMSTTEAELPSVMATMEAEAIRNSPELEGEIRALMPTIEAGAEALLPTIEAEAVDMLPTIEAESRDIMATIEAGGTP